MHILAAFHNLAEARRVERLRKRPDAGFTGLALTNEAEAEAEACWGCKRPDRCIREVLVHVPKVTQVLLDEWS